MRKSIACLIFCLIAPLLVKADIVFNPNCIKAYQYIGCLRMKEAALLLEKEKRDNPNNAAVALLENYSDFLTTFVLERPEDFEHLKANEDKHLAQIISKGNPKSPWYLYAQAEIYIECGFVKFKFKEYVTAAYQIRKGYKLLEKNLALFPDFKPSLKSLSFLHAMIGSVPENYQWIVNTIGMKGTVQQGLKEINLLNNSLKGTEYAFLQSEAAVIAGLMNYYINKDYKSTLEWYAKAFPNKEYNPIVCFSTVNVYVQQGRCEEALKILTERPKDERYLPVPILEYQTGLIKLFKQDKDAGGYFLKYSITFKGSTYAKAAWQKLAWSYLLQGNKVKYYEYISKCKEGKDATTDEDKQALAEAISGEVPNVTLLKVRLWTDGNYLNQALSELTNIKVNELSHTKDKIEYTYRLGRVYQKLGEGDKAIRHYQQTIAMGRDLPHYFAASAALETGFIYELRGDKQAAGKSFKTCLQMRNHEYQNGIDQKAKAGLNRLGIN